VSITAEVPGALMEHTQTRTHATRQGETGSRGWAPAKSWEIDWTTRGTSWCSSLSSTPINR
jgi:hypothetical protein